MERTRPRAKHWLNERDFALERAMSFPSINNNTGICNLPIFPDEGGFLGLYMCRAPSTTLGHLTPNTVPLQQTCWNLPLVGRLFFVFFFLFGFFVFGFVGSFFLCMLGLSIHLASFSFFVYDFRPLI